MPVKINKIRPKFHFSTKIETKWLTLSLCFVIYCLFASRAIWKRCTNSKKNGKAGDSEADRYSSKLHKSHENGPNSPKLPSKNLLINVFPFYASGVLDFITTSGEALDFNLFSSEFLSRDAYDRALGRDVINGRSKLTSQEQFASVRGRAQCIASVIASSTVGESLGPFDRDKARQNITRATGHSHSTERPSSLLRLLGLRCFLTEPFRFIHRTSYPTRAYYMYTYFATLFVTLISYKRGRSSLSSYEEFMPIFGEPKNLGLLCRKHNRSNSNLGEKKNSFFNFIIVLTRTS